MPLTTGVLQEQSQPEFRKTIQQIKEVKKQILELQQQEHQLYNKLWGEIDDAFLQAMKDIVT